MIGIVACLALAGWVILRSLLKKPDADI
jgi:hypothetical protein